MSLSTDPISGLRVFEDTLNRMLSEPRTSRPWSPAVDILETENAIVLKADVPAVDPKDIDIEVQNQTLTVKGQRHFDKSEATKGFHRIERSFGSFVRSFAVPTSVDTEKVNADYKNGVLTISLPKKEAAKPRQIKIETVAN
jgi:HSP20 family protein